MVELTSLTSVFYLLDQLEVLKAHIVTGKSQKEAHWVQVNQVNNLKLKKVQRKGTGSMEEKVGFGAVHIYCKETELVVRFSDCFSVCLLCWQHIFDASNEVRISIQAKSTCFLEVIRFLWS